MGNESSSSNFDGRNIRVEHVRSIWRKVAKGKLLGNGGFSQVYLVTPISRKEIKKVPRLERKKSAYSFPDLISQNQDLAQPDRRQLAMKVIPHRYQHLFYHEVQVMRRLMHENIVNIIKAYKDSKACYILMENLEGRELLEHIIEQKQNSFDEKEAAYYIRQILLALDHLHNNNVVHLDLYIYYPFDCFNSCF